MKKISSLLILAGLILLAVPFAGRLLLSYQQGRLLQEYQEELAQKPEENSEPGIMDENYDDGTSSEGAVSSGNNSVSNHENAIGTIEIPSISVSLLLLEGSTSKELRYGAGHVEGTAMPGQAGNCAIAGHRNYTFGSYFSRLDEVLPGDEITVEYEGASYTYIMEDSITVLPTETSVLAQNMDEKRITLITCTPRGSNTHRLIVRGRLSE